MLWTAYLNDGLVPHGREFVRTVQDLARRAGVDPSPIERPQPPDRRAELLQTFIDLCRRELESPHGTQARAYLERRGLPAEAVQRSDIGLVPSYQRTSEALQRAGYREAEIMAAGIYADSRWPGRLCGPWRNEHGKIGTLWARTLNDTDPGETRYLYLRGATRTNLPPYGLSDLLTGPRATRREILLVEGFFDLHQLRAHGIQNVAALGGLGITPRTFERLAQLGIEKVTLCLDRDQPGRAATARAIEHAAQAQQSPAVYVIDPDRLAPADDPDTLIRQSGIHAWLATIQTRECGITWRANQFLPDITPDTSQPERRAALARAGGWLGTLPARLALEQEDAVHAIAQRTGYSPQATARSFRARFWSEPSLEPRPELEMSSPTL